MAWKLVLLDEVSKVLPDAPLKGSDIRVELPNASYALPSGQKLGPLTFAFDVSAKGFIEGYDAPADVDAAGVVGEASSTPERLSPPLVFGDDQAWLKYAVEARVKAEVGFPLPYVALAANGDVRVLLADYHRHTQDTNARAALKANAGELRLPLLTSSLEKLGVGDAISFQARGELSVTATLDWTDVYTTNLQALTKLLSASTMVAFEAKAGATVSAKVKVTDDYAVIFSRPEAGKIRVQVKKVVAREAGVTADLHVEASLTDPAAVLAQVEHILEGLLSVPLATFESLMTKLETHTLSEAETKVLRIVLDRLGFQELEAAPTALRTAWEKLRADARTRVQALAEAKFAAGFRYEYLRLREQTTLLSTVCTDAQAQALHPMLVGGDMSRAMQHMQTHNMVLEQCLLKEVSKESQAWGFSLRLGSWAMGGNDERSLTQVVQRNSLEREAPQRISFLGVRRYTGTLFTPYAHWTADFKADMSEFRKSPTVADFDLGLYLMLRRDARKRGEDDLRQSVDEAIIWGALDDAEEEEVLKRIRAASGGKAIETRVELKLDNRTLRDVITHSADPDAPTVFARALARALPWYSVPCRDRPTVRESVYAGLWRAYLDQNWSASDAAKTAAATLKNHPLVGLFAYTEGQLGNSMLTFAEVIQKNPGTVSKWHDLRAGLLDLRNNEQRSPAVFSGAFKALSQSWAQSFHLKATGAFFLELAARGGNGLATVERTFTVTVPDTGVSIVFSKSRA
ncbi:hypothetical protein D7Y13_24945 [Corallococcus praedator]|uniref:Uncharacterized protein n=1 Tax=Corallococcus praedator TaxID=2316724 RepID=A0ABX9QD86_9BACT|nr:MULTISPECIES: hypothetical protein [Corallococcus]RKH36105.1 hypothetical protein D7X75_01500 [Corallococcus sp. CA031C]RKI02304.1 hypothetical protein D7Y13_24945 [Corallococcus praedator]